MKIYFVYLQNKIWQVQFKIARIFSKYRNNRTEWEKKKRNSSTEMTKNPGCAARLTSVHSECVIRIFSVQTFRIHVHLVCYIRRYAIRISSFRIQCLSAWKTVVWNQVLLFAFPVTAIFCSLYFWNCTHLKLDFIHLCRLHVSLACSFTSSLFPLCLSLYLAILLATKKKIHAKIRLYNAKYGYRIIQRISFHLNLNCTEITTNIV